ncbi:Transferrin receptor protein [Trichinella pseudospiralis]
MFFHVPLLIVPLQLLLNAEQWTQDLHPIFPHLILKQCPPAANRGFPCIAIEAKSELLKNAQSNSRMASSHQKYL